VKTLTSPLDDTPKAQPAPRIVVCARCSRLSAEYERYDPNWTPLPAVSYWRDGRRYHLAHCEPCSWIEFEAGWQLRVQLVGPPSEAGLSQREQAARSAALTRLDQEKQRYLECRRARELATKTPSGRRVPVLPAARTPGAPPVTDEGPTFVDWLESKGITSEQFEEQRSKERHWLERFEENR
jgi:hypothetical protein